MKKSVLWIALAGLGITVGGVVAMRREAKIETVPARLVCMMNDRVMGKPQIPVEVEGKTYFGCCPGCAKKLKGDPGIRTASDPVTGRSVDKAAALILEGPEGQALYFETPQTARRYLAAASGS